MSIFIGSVDSSLAAGWTGLPNITAKANLPWFLLFEELHLRPGAVTWPAPIQI
jgi:hypothetical protein